MRGARNKTERCNNSKGASELRRLRRAEIEAWAADRRAGYRRDMMVEFLRGLPSTVKWVSITIAAATGGGLVVTLARTWPGLAA
jgi:hypothetical protein